MRYAKLRGWETAVLSLYLLDFPFSLEMLASRNVSTYASYCHRFVLAP